MKHLKLCLIAFVTLCFLLAGSTAFADLTLPDSMTVIGEQAFMNDARLLGTVTIPEGVTTIGKEAFYCCTGIDTLVLPYSVEKIESRAFAGCSGLTGTVVLPYGCEVAEDAFDGCEELTVEQVGVTPEEYFTYEVIDDKYCRVTGYTGSAADVVIPNLLGGYTVREIRTGAFARCKSLQSIIIPTGITYIGQNAFHACENLCTLVLPEGLDFIDVAAFSYCYSLKTVTIPASVTKIRDSAFHSCLSLSDIKVASGSNHFSVVDDALVSNDGVMLAYPIGLKPVSYSVPSVVEVIGDCVFDQCDSLVSIEIHPNVEEIGTSAFSRCTQLRNVNLPAGLKYINRYTFSDCSMLESIDLPDGILRIELGAFAGCSSLNSIELPNDLRYIELDAFRDCVSLTEITIPASVREIEDSIFNGCSSLEVIHVDQENQYNSVINGALISKSGILIDYPCNAPAVSFTAPASITAIVDLAFYGSSNLQSVELQDGITEIGRLSFVSCSNLDKVYIPSTVTQIGYGAFSKCSSRLTIYGVSGSYAEEYALKNRLTFIAGEMPEPDYGEMNASAAVTVLSHDGIPLTGINVEVLTVSDMAVAKRGVTDAQGQVVFNGLQLRSYIFRCSDELFEFDDKYYTLTETESALTLTAKEPAFGYLAANADSYTAEAGGSTVSIAVSSSGDWRASTQDAWLTLGASEGVPGEVLSVTAAANDGLFRTGTVTLASGEWEISVYIQQAGAMSSRLPDPVITTPAEETVTVPYGDITITWEPVEGAGSYVISMRDLTTDDLILHHERLADQTQAVLNALHFSDDHSYRVAVGAVPPGAASTESCVSWKEIVFVVEEFIDDTPVSFSGTVYELFDPSLVSTFQLIARNGMNPELMAQARESAEINIDYQPFPDCTVQIYHLAKDDKNEEWWEFVSETKTQMYGEYTFDSGLIAEEKYSIVVTEDDYDFLWGKIEQLTYTAQPGNNQVIDIYGFDSSMNEKIEAFRQIAANTFDITGYPSGLFAEYFEYDKRKKSSYMYLTDEKIPSETSALLANYKRNEGVVSNVNFTWSGETVKKSGATYYALNAYKFGADPDKASAKDTVNYVPFNFAASFNGYIKLKGADNADELKSYMFRVRGDDGVKLKLNLPFYESYAEDEWSNRGLSENEAVIDLTSEAYLNGTVLKVGIAYYNKTDGGEANLTFEYSIDKGKSWHVVPSSWLYHSPKERQISVLGAEAYGGINYAAKLAQSQNQLANYGDHLVTKMLLDLGSMSIDSAVSAYNTGTVMFSEISLSSSDKLARYVKQKIGVNTTKAVYAAVVKRSTNVSTEKDLWAAIAAELKGTYSIEFDTVYDATTNTIDGIATMQSMMNAMSDNASSNASITRLQYDVLDYIESYSIGDLSDLDSSSGNVKAGYSTLFELTGSERKELENEVVKLDSGVKSVWGFAVKGIELLNVLSDPDAANRNRAALYLMFAETQTLPNIWDMFCNFGEVDQEIRAILQGKFAPLGKTRDDFTNDSYEIALNSLSDRVINEMFSALQKVNLRSLLYNDLLKLVLDTTYSHYKKAFNGKI